MSASLLFSGFGFFVTILLFFAAILAFQLRGLPKETPRSLGLVGWGFALCFVVITDITSRYFFTVPGVRERYRSLPGRGSRSGAKA